MVKFFSHGEIVAIAKALGDTSHGLTNSEIDDLFVSHGMLNPGPMTKWKRLEAGFIDAQNRAQKRKPIIEFITDAMGLHRYVGNSGRWEELRLLLNQALLLSGMKINEKAKLVTAQQAETLPEAERRARDLRMTLEARNVHPDVVKFCRSEFLQNDYFHAVLEACKSMAEKIRDKSGLASDGNRLVGEAFDGGDPVLVINAFSNSNEINEHRGFTNLLRGVISMFRNPTAHAPRIHWSLSEQDAAEIMGLLSLIHRRLDVARRRH